MIGTPTEWTTVAGVIVGSIGTVALPVWLQRRKAHQDADSTILTSWQQMTAAMREERDELRQRLDDSETRHRRQVQELEQDWDRKLVKAQQRITQLEQEIEVLRRMIRHSDDAGRGG